MMFKVIFAKEMSEGGRPDDDVVGNDSDTEGSRNTNHISLVESGEPSTDPGDEFGDLDYLLKSDDAQKNEDLIKGQLSDENAKRHLDVTKQFIDASKGHLDLLDNHDNGEFKEEHNGKSRHEVYSEQHKALKKSYEDKEIKNIKNYLDADHATYDDGDINKLDISEEGKNDLKKYKEERDREEQDEIASEEKEERSQKEKADKAFLDQRPEPEFLNISMKRQMEFNDLSKEININTAEEGKSEPVDQEKTLTTKQDYRNKIKEISEELKKTNKFKRQSIEEELNSVGKEFEKSGLKSKKTIRNAITRAKTI